MRPTAVSPRNAPLAISSLHSGASMSTTKNRSAGCRNLLDQSIRAHMPRPNSMAYYQYLELISIVRSQSTMLAPRNIQGASHQRTVNRIIYALSKMAAYWSQWQRSIYSWLPDLSSSATNQYYSLIDHLFVHCLLYTSPSPRDRTRSRMPSSA